jgi:hypothetical protein
MAAEKDALPTSDEFLRAINECFLIATLVRASIARLRESKHHDASIEIQDAEQLLDIAVRKTDVIFTFLDDADARIKRYNPAGSQPTVRRHRGARRGDSPVAEGPEARTARVCELIVDNDNNRSA